MEKKQNKESGYGAIIIFVVAALALTLFLTYFRSLNDNDEVMQRANRAAGALKDISIKGDVIADELEEIRLKMQATVAVLVTEEDANVQAAILAGRFAGDGTGFEGTVVNTLTGDKVFLGFLSPGGVKTSSTVNVTVRARTAGEIPGGSAGNGSESIDVRTQELQQNPVF